jgi:hypothetical protein
MPIFLNKNPFAFKGEEILIMASWLLEYIEVPFPNMYLYTHFPIYNE